MKPSSLLLVFPCVLLAACTEELTQPLPGRAPTSAGSHSVVEVIRDPVRMLENRLSLIEQKVLLGEVTAESARPHVREIRTALAEARAKRAAASSGSPTQLSPGSVILRVPFDTAAFYARAVQNGDRAVAGGRATRAEVKAYLAKLRADFGVAR